MRTKNVTLMDRIIEFINNQYYEIGRTPTMREIAKEMQIAVGSVKNYIVELENRGLLTNSGTSRGLMTEKMIKSKSDFQQVPIVGSIACGSPIFAEENIESYLPISNEFLGSGKFFILKAQGNSMINAGISNGDYVIVRQQETAEEGQIIVALIDDEATLKRYYLDKENKKVRLHPENKAMKDMYFDSIVIQGVAIKVIKDLL